MNKLKLNHSHICKHKLQIIRPNNQIAETIIPQQNKRQNSETPSKQNELHATPQKSKFSGNHMHFLEPLHPSSNIQKMDIVLSEQNSNSQFKQSYSSMKMYNRKSKMLSLLSLPMRESRVICMEQAVCTFMKILQKKKEIKQHFENLLVSQSNMNKILLYLIYLFQNKKKYGGRISKQLVDPELYEEFIRIFEKGEVAFKETGKISSNKLAVYSHLGEIIIEGSMGNSCQTEESQSALLEEKNSHLLHDIIVKRLQKDQLDSEISVKQSMLQQLLDRVNNLQNQIQHQKHMSHSISARIEQKQDILQKLQDKKLNIERLISYHQTPIMRSAAQYRQNLETQIMEFGQFCEYLKCHPLGSRTFQLTSSSNQVQRLFNNELKQLSRLITEQKQISLDKKAKCVNDFANKMRHQFIVEIGKLVSVIDEKTNFICKFTIFNQKIMHNYLAKKELISKLKYSYTMQLVKLDSIHAQVLSHTGERCHRCNLLLDKEKERESIIEQMTRIYEVGSSLY